MEINTNRASASIRMPYTCIMPLLAKNAKKTDPLLREALSFFLALFFGLFLVALACFVTVDVLGFEVGLAATWLTIFIADK